MSYSYLNLRELKISFIYEGVKKRGSVHIFSSLDCHVFQMDDYMSLISGGTQFLIILWIFIFLVRKNIIRVNQGFFYKIPKSSKL